MPQEDSIPVKPKFSKKKIILLFIVALLLINAIVFGLVYTFIIKSYRDASKRAELSSQILPTPSPSIEAIISPSPTSIPGSQTPTPTTSTTPVSYNYPYLDLSLKYPAGWKLTVDKSNTEGSDYTFPCTDDGKLIDYLRSAKSCANNEIMPENLILTKDGAGKVALWQASGLGGMCPEDDCKQETIKLYGKDKTFTLRTNPDTKDLSTPFGIVIETGPKSVWKNYVLSFTVDPEHYSEVKEIIASITLNK